MWCNNIPGLPSVPGVNGVLGVSEVFWYLEYLEYLEFLEYLKYLDYLESLEYLENIEQHCNTWKLEVPEARPCQWTVRAVDCLPSHSNRLLQQRISILDVENLLNKHFQFLSCLKRTLLSLGRLDRTFLNLGRMNRTFLNLGRMIRTFLNLGWTGLFEPWQAEQDFS